MFQMLVGYINKRRVVLGLMSFRSRSREQEPEQEPHNGNVGTMLHQNRKQNSAAYADMISYLRRNMDDPSNDATSRMQYAEALARLESELARLQQRR
jgi:hypothetical protein